VFLLNLLGYQQARNYDGSMYEWANLEESEAPMAATD
jgi:3-mercaptopyruvate sulfurtransferase SseA